MTGLPLLTCERSRLVSLLQSGAGNNWAKGMHLSL